MKASRMWNDEELRQALSTEGLTYEEYRQSLRNQLLRSRLVGKEIKSKIVITTEDVRAYYDEQADAYGGELRYHLRNIIILIASLDEEDAGLVAKNKMDVILKELGAGESFEALARKYSESSLAEQGGDLGKILYTDISPQIKQALEGLVPGDYTPVLETDQGLQIFFIEDIVTEGGKSLEEASPEIEELLYNQALDKKYEAYLEDLKNRSHIKIIQ